MAERYAVSAGNWVAARFDGGTLPGVGDTVHANGFAVTIDTSITVDALSTRAGAVAVAGGSFTASGTVTITADTYGGTTTCLSLSGFTQKQVGDSYGSLTNNNARGTTMTNAAKQEGDCYAGSNGGVNRDGTAATNGSIVFGNSYGGTDAAINGNAGIRLTTGSSHIGDAIGGHGIGTHMNTGSVHYGRQFGGVNFGCFVSNGSLVITTQITAGPAKGIQVSGGYVILQNGTSASDVDQVGSNGIGATLSEFPYIIEGGGGVAGFTGIRGTHRTLGT